jgi:hypothetical protein
MSKPFNELLHEEKSFVLQHLSNEAEYTSLRDLLLEMHELSFDAELKDPPESLETALLHGFAEHAEKERGYRYRFAPWMGWAIAATVVGFCVLFFWPASEHTETAFHEQTQQKDTDTNKESASPSIEKSEPRSAVTVPAVMLPSDVERLLAEVVPASTPAAPPFAASLYEYEDAVKSVRLTELLSAEEEDVLDFAPADESAYSVAEIPVSTEDLRTVSPAVANVERKNAAASETAREETSTSRITAETKVLGKANRKKRRNPDVLKLSQTKKLKSLLRSE